MPSVKTRCGVIVWLVLTLVVFSALYVFLARHFGWMGFGVYLVIVAVWSVIRWKWTP